MVVGTNIKKIKFGKLKIQKLNRIALPNSLLENLNISVGDNIEVFLDIEKQEIIISSQKTKTKNKRLLNRIKFGKLKIQQLNRIALPSSLLENLDLQVRNYIESFLDIEKQEIVIKRLEK